MADGKTSCIRAERRQNHFIAVFDKTAAGDNGAFVKDVGFGVIMAAYLKRRVFCRFVDKCQRAALDKIAGLETFRHKIEIVVPPQSRPD